jgi:tetratricopeptide (TPR) repeat protein
VLFPTSCVSAASFLDAAKIFLTNIGIPSSAHNSLFKDISVNGEKDSYITEVESAFYSFAGRKRLVDKDKDIQHEIETATADFLILRARRDLVLHLMKEKVNRKHYPNDDALDNAVYSLYERSGIAGIQSSTEVVEDWVFALAWLEKTTAKAVQKLPLETSELSNDYCAFLYERAKTFFNEKKYSDALSIFKHIHDYQWANVGLYLNAAESFFKTGEVEESLKLLKELQNTLNDKMSSEDWERVGRLFRVNGDKKAALDSFKEARKRYRKEQ